MSWIRKAAGQYEMSAIYLQERSAEFHFDDILAVKHAIKNIHALSLKCVNTVVVRVNDDGSQETVAF